MIAEAVALNARSALIDGEAVMIDAQGRTSFQALQAALKGDPGEILYYAFDLLAVDGEDLTSLPLIDRKRKLAEQIGQGSPHIRYSAAMHRRDCCPSNTSNQAFLFGNEHTDTGLVAGREICGDILSCPLDSAKLAKQGANRAYVSFRGFTQHNWSGGCWIVKNRPFAHQWLAGLGACRSAVR
ncbi:hypothetical protein [Sphingobium sp. BHU LFT2]|uniref:ATP-dependent DNA ligase n=1 Tax=Sphingobium sp. BHU LFT2 TaxID=2807634 RepID=UPI00333B5E5A